MSSVEDAGPDAAEWYATVPLAAGASHPAVARAWLIETVHFHEEHGPRLPRFIAVYESTEITSLDDAYLPPSNEWKSAPSATTGERVSARAVLMNLWTPSPAGRWWASVRADIAGTPLARSNRDDFERWYTFQHVGETVVADGFHEGWRLGEELYSSGPSAHHSHERWAMYDIEKPEDMMIHVNKAPLEAIWNDTVDHATFGRTYHRVVAAA